MEEIYSILKNFDFSNIVWQIITPLIFSVADFVTGFIQAVINKNVDSQKMRNGLLHKTLLLIIILLSFIIDFSFNIHFVSKSICVFVIGMEIVSIAENFKKAGVDLGKFGRILAEKTDKSINQNLEKLINTIDEEIKKD